jgi:hypothetical protein
MQSGAKARFPHPAALTTIVSVLIAASFAAALLVGPGPADAGASLAQEPGGQRVATPVATTPEPTHPAADDPLDGDPHDGDSRDGDPLDGPPPREDPGVPQDQSELEIVRSGRPEDLPTSLPAYDDDPQTVWAPEPSREAPWLWVDLGAERRVREIRWLARGGGAVEVAVSSDRRRWDPVDEVDVDDGWQGVALRDDARYVRLSLQPGDDAALPALAEVTVYGKEGKKSVAAEQQASKDRGRKRQRADSGRKSRQQDKDAGASQREAKRGGSRAGNGHVTISTAEGETSCKGKRARCKATPGEVSAVDDCGADGTCTIDIQANGGTASCDASATDEARAGAGEGKRGADGGTCEATANGGAVAIGDINP